MKEQPGQFLTYLNISFNFLVTLEKIGNSFQALKVIDANANRIVSLDLNDVEFPCLEALVGSKFILVLKEQQNKILPSLSKFSLNPLPWP